MHYVVTIEETHSNLDNAWRVLITKPNGEVLDRGYAKELWTYAEAAMDLLHIAMTDHVYIWEGES